MIAGKTSNSRFGSDPSTRSRTKVVYIFDSSIFSHATVTKGVNLVGVCIEERPPELLEIDGAGVSSDLNFCGIFWGFHTIFIG